MTYFYRATCQFFLFSLHFISLLHNHFLIHLVLPKNLDTAVNRHLLRMCQLWFLWRILVYLMLVRKQKESSKFASITNLLPLKLVLWCNGKMHPVKLRPDIGYFVKTLPMDIELFTTKESQLPGMFEYIRRSVIIIISSLFVFQDLTLHLPFHLLLLPVLFG